MAGPKKLTTGALNRDTILTPAFAHLAKAGDATPSSIFKGESANRLGNLIGGSGSKGETPTTGGIRGFGRTNTLLPTGDLNSAFALPALGEGWWSGAAEPDDLAGLAVQASRALASARGEGGFDLKAAYNNTTLVQPFFHTPGNAQDAFNLPKSYIEQIRWSRLMYNLNAYIGAITDLKAYYGLSMFKVNTPEPFVTEFYEEESFNKNFNLYEFMCRMSLGFQKFGEAIPWGSRIQKGTWPKTGKPIFGWSHFILLEPELVEIKRDFFGGPKPRFYLRPSKDLEDMVRKMDDGDPEVVRYADRIAEPIKQRIRQRELVPLDNSTISAIQNLTDASATRGTPPYQRLFVTYVYEDFVRLAQMAQAQRYHFPVELWTLGDLEKNILPNTSDLENLRTMVTNAVQSPPFSIFFPPVLKYEALGVSGKLLSIAADYKYVQQMYTVGLGVSENMILGEALALDTLIPTPTGWTTMGELKVGDKLFARDGSVTEVSALSPIWKDRPTYSVKVNSAEPLVADENHKWVIRERQTTRSKVSTGYSVISKYLENVYSTKEVFRGFASRGKATKGQLRYSVPMMFPLDLPPLDLPFPPYTLGAWLGDGSTDGLGKQACHEKDSEIIENIRLDGFDVIKSAGYCEWYIRGAREMFRSAGLMGNKHIPSAYLRASHAQRLALLQGLMDTDGTCGHSEDKRRPGRQCDFGNTNEALVVAVRELLLTLGFRPGSMRLEHRKDPSTPGGKGIRKPYFYVRFVVGEGQPIPFRLSRKVARCRVPETAVKHATRQCNRRVEAVDRVPSVPTRCIQVAHPSGTFLAGRDFVVTHNSGIFSSTETSSNQAFIRARKKDRDSLEEWARWNFYEPLARWNNLKIKKGGKLVPILPDFEWEKTLDYQAEEKEIEMRKFLFKEGVYPTKRFIARGAKENPEEIELELKAELGGVFDNGKRIGAPEIRTALAAGKPAAGGTPANTTGGGAPTTDESPVPGGAGGAGGGTSAPAPEGGDAAAGAGAAAPEGAAGAEGAETATPGETAELL